MCFSASASFTAAAGLGLISLISLKKVTNTKQRMFAAIPLLFALQQFSEGLVWLAAENKISPAWKPITAYLFLIFAFMVWPVWIPVSLLLLEKNYKQKKILQFLSFCGVAWSSVLAFLLWQGEVVARVNVNNMCYHISSFDIFGATVISNVVLLVLYFVPVIIPLFVSSIQNIWMFGVAGIVSSAITILFWRSCFISVWCYFAAILSIMIVLLFPKDTSIDPDHQ